MTLAAIPFQLTPEQQGQLFGILSVGCDRETAANYIGCTPAEIGLAMRHDSNFSDSVRRTEAAAELGHMRIVHEAAKDPKNWRASVWWLERRSPERFGSRGAGTITARNLKAFIQILSEHLNNDIQNEDDRQRVLRRLQQLQLLAESFADDLTVEQASTNEETTADDTSGDLLIDHSTSNEHLGAE